MLPSPRDIVIGASDLERAAAFLALFGFAEHARGSLPAAAARALYGLGGPADELVIAVPGADRGRVRLVATPTPPRSFAVFDSRPFALDLFTTDIGASIALATDGGWHSSPITDHRFGPVLIREVEITGPDGVIVTLLQPSAGRRSSILDTEPTRLHSEVHAFVWSAVGLDGLLPYWRERGLDLTTDAVMDTPGLGALVGVPDEDVSMRLAVLADGDGRPVRLEYVEFLGKPAARQPSLPLAAGLHAPAFEVSDLDAVLAKLAPAEVGEIVELNTPLHPHTRAGAATTPGGQCFEVWEGERG